MKLVEFRIAIIACTVSFLAGFLIGAAAGGYVVGTHQQAKIERLKNERAAREVAVAEAARAVQKKQDDLALASAVAEAEAQQKIVTQIRTIIKEVPRYVSPQVDARTCVTYGLVRLLDAAAQGVDPASLELPAGKSDDDCAPVKASDLAASVADNYGTARQNARQLDALIADIRARVDSANRGQDTAASNHQEDKHVR